MEAGKTDPELLQARALSLATPLMQAALNGDINAMDSLLHAGAAVSEKNRDGIYGARLCFQINSRWKRRGGIVSA